MAHPANGYRLENGSRVPGTTTVIGRFKDSGPLLWWAFEQGKSAERGEISSLYDKRDEAGETGTLVHSCVEQHIRGEDLPEIPEQHREQVMQGFGAYLDWERMTRLEITHQEIQLVCPEFRFGGCPDAIGMIDGKPCLIDWKTSKSVYPDMLIQLAAYDHLIKNGLQMENGYKPLGINVSGYHLCKFSKEFGTFSHHYFPPGSLDVAWSQFRLFRRAYDNDGVLKRLAG